MSGITHFHLAALITSFFNLALILIVSKWSTDKRLSKRFILYGLSIILWSSSLFTFSSTDDPELSFIACQLLHVGAMFIPCLFLHFVVTYLNINSRFVTTALLLAYIGNGIFLILNLFQPALYIGTVIPKLGFPNFMTGGKFYGYWVALFFSIVIFTHGVLVFGVFNSRGIIRKQRVLFFLGNLVGYCGGIGIFLPVYNITYFPFPYGAYGVALFSGITAYTIFKFRFISVDLLVRKTLVFTGLFAFVFGVFALVSFVTQELLSTYVGTAKWPSILASVAIIIVAYDPLRKLITNLTDRFLFQKKFDYKKLLKDASAGISRIKSLHHLTNLVVHFITMRVRIKNAAVLLFDDTEQLYRLTHPRGFDDYKKVRAGLAFDRHDPMIEYMAAERKALDIEKVKARLEETNSKSKHGRETNSHDSKYNWSFIKLRMDDLHAACFIPSFLGNELKSILVLGEKKSENFYTEEDMSVLFTLAQESAIAIENAQLYDDAIRKTKELELKSDELQVKSDELLKKTDLLERQTAELEQKKTETEAVNEELNIVQTNLIKALDEMESTNKRLKQTQGELIEAKKRALLAGISSAVGHEIRNPLTPVVGHLYGIEKNLDNAHAFFEKIAPKLTEEETQEFFTIISSLNRKFSGIQRGADRIKGVVNTLVNLVRERTDRKEEVQLKLVVASALEEVRFQTYAEALTIPEIQTNIPADLPFIKGITQDLQGVFVNLVINSFHAMEKSIDKAIKIEACIDPDDDKMIKIEYEDTGCGIPSEVMSRIFEHGFTTKKDKGTGIGLFFCKDNIERVHGGKMTVKSEVGAGTRFTMTLPIYDGPDKSTQGGRAAIGR